MTVTGAARIFGALVGEASAASLPLASALLIQTKRAGQLLPEVRPEFHQIIQLAQLFFRSPPIGPPVAGAGRAEQSVKGQVIEFVGHAVLHG